MSLRTSIRGNIKNVFDPQVCGTSHCPMDILDELSGRDDLVVFKYDKGKLTDDGLKIIMPILEQNKNLTTISLCGNELTNVNPLATLIKSREHKLCCLYLSNNQITHEGSKLLAESLFYNRSLIVIGIENNKLGPDGVSYFLDHIEYYNRSISGFDCRNNEIPPPIVYRWRIVMGSRHYHKDSYYKL